MNEDWSEEMLVTIGDTEFALPFEYEESTRCIRDERRRIVARVYITKPPYKIGYFIADALNAYACTPPAWIKIESAGDLPRYEGDYLVQLKNGKMRVANYAYRPIHKESLFYLPYGEYGHDSVAAWQPLPEPYQETTTG